MGENTGQEESHKGQDKGIGVKGPAQWARGGRRHGTVAELVITTERAPSLVKSEGCWKETPHMFQVHTYSNALLYLVPGPGPALMSLIASISRCYRWLRSRSPPSRRHSNRG